MANNIPIVEDIQESVARGTPSISDRLFGAGLPLRRITRGQQLQQQRANADELLEKPMDAFNRSNEQYHISMTGDGMFQIRDNYSPSGSQPLMIMPTPQELVTWAEENLNLSAPAFEMEPYQAPTWQNMMEMLSAAGQTP